MTITTVDTSETNETCATPGTAQVTKPGGNKAGSAAGIKRWFKSAAKALARPDDEPQPEPEARKRRSGGSEGRLLAMRSRRLYVTKSAARGRYKRLAVPQFPPEDEFARTADLLCSVPEGIANIFADLARRLEVVIYGKSLAFSDTLDWQNLWQDNANNAQWHDDDFSAKQDQYFPQP